MKACRAVLHKPTAIAASRSLTIHGGGTTSLSEVNMEEVNSKAWYNLNGQRISQPTKKGIYINNGKKVKR